MKKLRYILFATCLLFLSCSNDENSKEEDSKKLEIMYNEIIDLSLVNSQTCTDSKDWSITGIGSKPCGGVTGYIAYSKKVNEPEFLNKVKAYTDAEAVFNGKWKIYSTCEALPPPASVECVDGKPKLTYNTALF
ncbi:hypothetical protein GKZ90_0009745 [Flavobacterium sp. MC2016-06]|jgi:hypothetical protein|uniref:hypothetical protein n=1 Tax=Flavobacterium sp. MC2016-06 TaxID=2676308 RepID=UPI0012BAF6F6|nr:hypothetical protein [Flavobacterium sp. MC2016-06]MBU3859798.1 hypothetical protein [Flavobacterium sp. MC2016-06]